MERLFIGVDETNHGRDPEIVVAVFSPFNSDAKPKTVYQRERIEIEELQKRFQSGDRQYLAVEIPKNKGNKTEGNYLTLALPSLVSRYLEENEPGEKITLGLSLDGEFLHGTILSLCARLNRFKNIEICSDKCKCFPKSRVNEYSYPPILDLADSLAHHIFRERRFSEKLRQEGKLFVYS